MRLPKWLEGNISAARSLETLVAEPVPNATHVETGAYV